ncbi:MAG: glycosyltransferase, partial [Candidatus Thorarchaeota archaeon]|nr:glycosyltransferase [Candidatus Thorarchaeota archaeon]
MNICFVSDYYHPYRNVGGICTYVRYASRQLMLNRNRVHIVTPINGASRIYNDRGITVHEVGINSFLRYIPPLTFFSATRSRLSLSLGLSQYLKGMVAEHDIDVVEAPEWMAGTLFYSLAKSAPLVVRLHTPLFMMRGFRGKRNFLDDALASRLELLNVEYASAV